MRLNRAKEWARQLAGTGIRNLAVSMVMLGTGSLAVSDACAQVQEIPVRGMRGIASVGYRGNALTIEYNPRTCARLGPELCSFFRAHEYGHVALNHLGRGTPVRQAEYEADVWAARNSSPAARAAAVRYFQSGRGASWKHGSGNSRAARVASASASGRAGYPRISVRADGSRVVGRSYSAASARPFNTVGFRPLFRRR